MKNGKKRFLSLTGFFLPMSFVFLFAMVANADDDTDIHRFERKTASGQYSDPGSKFFLNGYVTGAYAKPDKDFGNTYMTEGQILINPPSSVDKINYGGFQGDVAIFFGSEPFQGLQAIAEIHFVRDALNPVITEAKVLWNLVDSDKAKTRLTLGAGRQWWPFGIQNRQWFSPVNWFNTISPIAALVLPPHVNDIGVWLEGYSQISQLGFNYVLALGNGPVGFKMTNNVMNSELTMHGWPAVTGRIGLFPTLDWVEIGLSGSVGNLRDAALVPSKSATAPVSENFAADFSALGTDLQIEFPFGLDFAGEFAWSNERLKRTNNQTPKPSSLHRFGFDAEMKYRLPLSQHAYWLWSLEPKIRYTESWLDDFQTDSRRHFRTLGAGINYSPIQQAVIKVEYVAFLSADDSSLTNHVFDVSLSMSW